MRAIRGCIGLIGWVLAAAASADSVRVTVLGQDGKPLANAVVYAMSVDTKPTRPPAKSAVIDQQKLRFVPLISVVQTGTSVSFPNSDYVKHHVYSFSPAKTFDIPLYSGTPAKPVVFDKAGALVLGCKIHDHMEAHVLVVDTPYFTQTDSAGRAELRDLPANSKVRAWYPGLQGAEPEAPANGDVTLRVPAKPLPARQEDPGRYPTGV